VSAIVAGVAVVAACVAVIVAGVAVCAACVAVIVAGVVAIVFGTSIMLTLSLVSLML